MDSISVVHLVWQPLGPDVLAKFLAAYRRSPAGIPHRLTVVFNGFANEAERAPYTALLAGVDYQAVVLPAPVQDLPAYHAAARAVTSEYACFLNSYSEPLASGWLAALYAHVSRPDVGLVGASGSWESHHTITADAMASIQGGGPAASAWRAVRVLRHGPRIGKAVAAYLRFRRDTRLAARLYDPFPNHHIRTNGFMLRREAFLSLRWPTIRTKVEALAFESGRDGLTRQIEARGKRVLVVGRDREGYDPRDWWRSNTYRAGDQRNLLVDDNRTRQFGEFEALDASTKERIFINTWGADPESTGRTIRGAVALADP